jgi:hypothetical protein
MNRGLIIRAFRELWPVTLVLSLVLMGMEALLAYVLPKFSDDVSQEWLKVDYTRAIYKAMLGTDVVDRIGRQMFQAMAWVDPPVIALVWAHAVVCCTRVPAREVDQGTADVFLGLPVSRREVFLSETLVWLACGAALFAAALSGNLLGGLGLPAEQRPPFTQVLPIVLNFFCLYVAAGGLAWLVSSFSSRRGRAMTIIFLILLVLFLLNYLAQFWKPLEAFAFLSPLHYHRPVYLLGGGAWPWSDMFVLMATGAVMWIAGGIVFARRDLCTV